MKVTYNEDLDVLRVLLNEENNQIEESDENKPGVVIDYDKAGNIVGFEILDASKRVTNPNLISYSVEKSA